MGDRNIGRELKAIMNLLRRLSYAEAKANGIDEEDACSSKKCKATAMHGMFIGYIAEHSKCGDVFQKDLEKEFSLRRSTATEILRLMEKNGYIKKENVPYDARLKKLVLTDIAKAEFDLAVARFKKMEERMVRGISDEELDAFCATLEKIKNNISEE